MALTRTSAAALVSGTIMPALLAERERLNEIDNWYRHKHPQPFWPKRSTAEAAEIAKRSSTPWGDLVVTSVAQACYLDGYRTEGSTAQAGPWVDVWQRNGMDRRQIAIHRAALAYGYAHVLELPGTDPITGARMPVVRGISPRRSIAFYRDPANDDLPEFFLEVDPARVSDSMGWNVALYDEANVYRFTAKGDGAGLDYLTTDAHDMGFVPAVRFANRLDLEGRTDGEIEPFIPIFARIDQTVFDRLVVQRFSSWVVRTAAGISPPATVSEDDAPAYMTGVKMRLAVDDVLVAEDEDTKFGSLPATPLDGFIEAVKSDIMNLAATSQTPAHEVLGQMANLSAEALAAARASLTAKVEERRKSFGESWEQVFRIGASIMGDAAAAQDVTASVRWADTEVRSLSQAADALGKMATLLHVPVEILWGQIPGWTDDDVKAAKALAVEGDDITRLAELLDRQAGTGGNPTPPDAPAA